VSKPLLTHTYYSKISLNKVKIFHKSDLIDKTRNYLIINKLLSFVWVIDQNSGYTIGKQNTIDNHTRPCPEPGAYMDGGGGVRGAVTEGYLAS